jgi:hypothetical protein
VAVCANDIALGDLVKDGLPAAPADACGDGELLVAEVIELENDRIGLAAVGAGMTAKELDEKGRAFDDEHVFPERRRRDVALSDLRRSALVCMRHGMGGSMCRAGPKARRCQANSETGFGSPERLQRGLLLARDTNICSQLAPTDTLPRSAASVAEASAVVNRGRTWVAIGRSAVRDAPRGSRLIAAKPRTTRAPRRNSHSVRLGGLGESPATRLHRLGAAPSRSVATRPSRDKIYLCRSS